MAKIVQIQLPFDIGTKVYFIHQDKILTGIVESFMVNHLGKDKVIMKVNLEKFTVPFNKRDIYETRDEAEKAL